MPTVTVAVAVRLTEPTELPHIKIPVITSFKVQLELAAIVPLTVHVPPLPTVHQLGFADLMVALKLLGEYPEDVVVIGVQPQSTDWSVELTEPVRESLDELLAVVIAQLESWAKLTEVR